MNRDVFLKGDREAFLKALSAKEIEHMKSIRSVDRVDTKIIVDNVDCSDLMINATWSGTKSEVSRKLEFSIIQNDAYYTPKINLSLHRLIQFFVDDKEVFTGYIFDVSKTMQGNEISITAYDGGIFLLKSQSFCKFIDTTPEAATRKVCAEVGVPVGKLENARPYTRIHDGDSIYEIIMTGYSLDSLETGKQYYALMKNGKLNVFLKGEVVFKYHLDSSNDIVDASYHISSDDVINRVKAYDESGNFIASFQLDNMGDYGGVLQAVYKGNDPQKEGKGLLKKPKIEANIDAFGDVSCLTGKAIEITENTVGLKGLFYIDSDTHVFENGLHKMSLGLSLENVMDRHEAGSEEENQVVEDAQGVQESSAVSKAKNFKVGSGKHTGKMTWPVPSTGLITCYFGVWLGNDLGGYHRGIDIGGHMGAPIIAADGGQVIHAGYGEDPSYGISVCINHGNGLFTRYAHMSAVSVRTGQAVSKGQRIGNVGNTGRSGGPHLHFEVLKNNKWGALQNPLYYVKYGR